MATYHVIAFDAEGQVMREYIADVDAPDGPHFIAQQVLHGTDVKCVEIRAPDGSVKLRQCGPGTDFDDIVKQES